MRLSRNGSDGRSLSSGKRSSPTTRSISSCALFWNSGYSTRASKTICKVLDVCRNKKNDEHRATIECDLLFLRRRRRELLKRLVYLRLLHQGHPLRVQVLPFEMSGMKAGHCLPPNIKGFWQYLGGYLGQTYQFFLNVKKWILIEPLYHWPCGLRYCSMVCPRKP
jgi:hypothetical protein